jgi:hypothetical protein
MAERRELGEVALFAMWCVSPCWMVKDFVSHEKTGEIVEQQCKCKEACNTSVQLTDYRPSFGMFARLGRRSRRRSIWRTRALPRRRPFRGSKEKERGMVRNSPARAGEQILRRLAYLLESIGVDVTVEVGETAGAGGAIFGLLTMLLALFERDALQA